MKTLKQVATRLLIWLALLKCGSAIAQPALPPLPQGRILDIWDFSGTNFLSEFHFAPTSATNVVLVPTWDGNGLQVDDTNVAWIVYPVVEPSGHTNLDLGHGTVETWISPDWNSADGLGAWGTIFEVGNWSTNLATATGAVGLFISPDGSNLFFSAQTNGVFTNYLSAPISWSAGDWHHVLITYSATNSELYLEGQFVTNGPGVSVIMSAEVLSNGFAIGSDSGTGLLQSRAVYNQFITYNYQLDGDTIAEDYAYDSQNVYPLPSRGGRFSMDDSGPPGFPGDGGTNGGGGGSTFYSPVFGSNDFWIEPLALGTNIYNTNANSLTFLIHGTVADVAYQLLSTTNLLATNTVWTAEQNLFGSEITNFTPTTIPLSSVPKKFFKAIAFSLDTDGDGLPDWWEIRYSLNPTNADTGNTGVQDGEKQDSAGDGYSNFEKYQMGVAPGTWVTPKAPSGFSAVLNTGGGSATLAWNPSRGNVTGYTVYIQTNTYPMWWGSDASSWMVLTNLSASQTNFTDSSSPGFAEGVSYQVQADYASGNSTLAVFNDPTINPRLTTAAQIVRGPLGHPYLVVSAMPQGIAALRVFLGDDGTYFEDMYYPILDVGSGNQQLVGSVSNAFFDIPVGDITNGVYQLSNTQFPLYAGEHFRIQALGSNGFNGNVVDYDPWPAWGNYRGSVTPWIGFADTTANIPFIDGRSNIAQNINFQLQAGQVFYPFQATSVGSTILHDSSQISYVNAGFHYSWDIGGGYGYQVGLDELQPFEENARYAQFCYSLNTLSSDGFLTNGVDPGWGIGTIDAPGIAPGCPFPFDTYGFASGGSTNAPTGVLSTSAREFIFYANWQDQGQGFLPNSDYSQLTFESGVKNVYGLNMSTAKWAGTNTPPVFSTITPVVTIPSVAGASFAGVQEASLSTVGYYFAQPNINPFPGEPGFSPTNTTPSSIIIPFGQHSSINAWAKQAVANGYSGTFAYPEQYFDKAFLADTSGNITTNQTGFLSEYGDFFPTQPGKVFLTTKADGATGTVGTNAINVIKLAMDVNHDGAIDLSFVGPDNTSVDRPFSYWVNFDWDAKEYDGDPGEDIDNPLNPVGDSGINGVHSERDLEDYARLWICGMPVLTNGYQVTLSWNVLSGAPAIQLINSVETNGGIGYLTNTTVAASQATVNYDPVGGTNYGPGVKFAFISPGQPYTFPSTVFTNSGNKYFLFDGSGVGKGELVLTVSHGTNVIAQTSAFIALNNVKDMFEHAEAQNVTASVPPSSLVSHMVLDSLLPPDPTEAKQMIIFVHGINNTPEDAENTAETMFKRLYWQGYQGRFSAFRWPCAYLPPTVANPFQYNKGEFYAWKSASAFKDYLSYLRNNTNRLSGYKIDVIAHSQGNVVASEAIGQGAPFDNYILTQGAIPAHCYDTNTNNVPFLQKLLDADSSTPTPFYPVNGGYHGYFTASITGNLIDFYNTNDFALATGVTTVLGIAIQSNWEEDQRTQKPEAFVGGPSYIYDSSTLTSTGYYTFGSHYTVTDPQELKAMVARSRSKAVGAQNGIHGVISSSFDLFANFGFGDTRPEHSAEFARPIQTVLPYYRQMLTSFQILP